MDDPKEDLMPLILDQLYFAFGLLVIGIILALLAFMTEITAGLIVNTRWEKNEKKEQINPRIRIGPSNANANVMSVSCTHP